MVDCDTDWYAYQCKSGEVLFYYNRTTGEHKWAIHFCSCLKSKPPNPVSEPCCVWEPIKSQSTESGRFVRSIGTQTDADENFNETLQSAKHVSLLQASPGEAIVKVLNENLLQNTEERQSAEVIIHDVMEVSTEENNCKPSKQGKVVMNEAAIYNLAPFDRELPSRVANNTLEGGGDRLLPLCRSTGHRSDFLYNEGFSDDRFVDTYLAPESSENQDTLLHNEESKDKFNTNCHNNGFSIHTKGASTTLNTWRSSEGSSSRKNPEPRKFLKKSRVSTDCVTDGKMERLWSDEPKKNLFGDTEESSYLEMEVDGTGTPYETMEGFPETSEEKDVKSEAQNTRSVVCELCGDECGDTTQLTDHIMKHQPTGSQCPICHRKFSRRVGLRFHVQTHTGDKPHQCHLCEKAFTKPASLAGHIRTHSVERPYQCPQCNKGFTHSSNLKHHIKTHSNERPFQCSLCNKKFKSSSHLALHRRIHSDERPYSCTHCSKRFKVSCHLNTHLKIHETANNYVCSTCDQGFKSFSQFSYHIQTNPECSGTSSGTSNPGSQCTF